MHYLGIRVALRFTFLDKLARVHLISEKLVLVESRGFGSPLTLRLGSSDVDVYDQLIRGTYVPMLHLPGVRTIVDLGSNIGLVAAYFLTNYPDSRLLAVEADPSNFALCRTNLERYGKRVQAVNAAIWSSNGQVQLKRFRDYYATQTEPVDNSSAVIVPAQDMQTLLAAFTIDTIDLLKVNIEGAELELFRSRVDWLNRVNSVVIELHGAECEKAFFDALTEYRYGLASSGALTICRNLRKAEQV